MRIEYQNVDIAQEEHVILKGVNFQAEAGEFVYLIGKVGTGKSSLLKTFYGELDVHTGSARVLDREMTKIKRRHIPYRTGQSGFRTQSDRMEKEEGTEHTHS